MPLPVPILEQVALNLFSALQGVTIANGYQCNINAVRRTTSDYPQVVNQTAVLFQGDAQKANVGETMAHVYWNQDFYIDLHVVVSQTEGSTIDTAINLLRADAEKAILADLSRGGAADLTTILGAAVFVPYQGEFEGLRLHVQVLYRTVFGNPYSR